MITKYTLQKFYFYENFLNKLLQNLLIYLNFNINDIYITEKHHLYKFCNNIKYELEIKMNLNIKYIFQTKKIIWIMYLIIIRK